MSEYRKLIRSMIEHGQTAWLLEVLASGPAASPNMRPEHFAALRDELKGVEV